MNIGLVGWGIETRSAFRYFGDQHNYLIVSEEPRDDFPTGKNITLQNNKPKRKPGLTGNAPDLSYLKGIENCDKVIYTPVARKILEKVYPDNHALWQKTKSTTEIFFEESPTNNIIGVTGTKGKGTTSSLIAKLLEAGDETVHLGGNIGIAALDLLPKIKESDWVVLEMSNFQLYKFPYSPHIAVHLMVVPEHIAEWHLEFDDYKNAKANIFAHQTADDVAIYLPTNKFSTSNAETSPGRHLPYMKPPGAHVENGWIVMDGRKIISTSDVGLLGAHNLENICAAVTATWQIHQNIDVIAKTIQDFKGLEHRLQLVRELHGIKYYDDSFGTTPDTAMVAMKSFAQPKVMIIGGHDKNNDFSELVKRLGDDDIRSIIVIGSMTDKIIKLAKSYDIPAAKFQSKEDGNSWTMKEIVSAATDAAKPGDIVLLSAGTSSFGIFKDYKDRGNQFAKIVNQLV